jgi:hypothetical protein
VMHLNIFCNSGWSMAWSTDIKTFSSESLLFKLSVGSALCEFHIYLWTVKSVKIGGVNPKCLCSWDTMPMSTTHWLFPVMSFITCTNGCHPSPYMLTPLLPMIMMDVT